MKVLSYALVAILTAAFIYSFYTYVSSNSLTFFGFIICVAIGIVLFVQIEKLTK
jgi:hypothetical protein